MDIIAGECQYIEGNTAEIDYDPCGGSREGIVLWGPLKLDYICARTCSTPCLPLRVRLKDYKPTKRLRRIRNRNADLRIKEVARANAARFYRDHHSGEFTPTSVWLTVTGRSTATSIGLYLEDKLVAVTTSSRDYGTIVMRDKSYPKRSLGLAVIDATIQHFQNMGNNYYYIGHANRATSRLSYKYSLPALEELKDNQWSKL